MNATITPVYAHESNQELEETQAAKEFFAKIDNIDTLQDETTRQWLGSLPDQWPNGAIPLFTDGEVDYQLHFSFTSMPGIDTSTFRSLPRRMIDQVEFYVHCIALASESGKMELVLNPLFIIPLGKLFLHRNGQSFWTGYEIFISTSLQVWIIYVPREPGAFSPHIVDSELLPPSTDKSNDTANKPLEQSPTQSVARVYGSLKGLRTATLHDIKDEVSKSVVRARSVYLLQLSEKEVSSAIKNFKKIPSIPRGKTIPTPVYISVANFSVAVTSLAASQLLQLASEDTDQPIAKIVFSAPSQPVKDQPLPLLAVEHNQEAIIKMINKSTNISAYASGIDFNDTKLIAVMGKLMERGFDKVLKFILDGIDFNRPDKSGTTPFLRAVRTGKSDLVKMILQDAVIDVNAAGKDGITSLMVAIEMDRPAMVHHLLNTRQVNINTTYKYGQTALLLAVKLGRTEIVHRILRVAGVDVQKGDEAGDTPLSIAEERQYSGVRLWLKEAIEKAGK